MVPKRCSRVEPISPSTWAEPRSDYSEWEGQSTPCARYNHPPSQGIDLERTQLASRCRRSPVWPCNDWNIFGNKAQDMVTWNEVPWGPLDHDHARGCDIKTMAQSGLERLLSSKHVMLLFIYTVKMKVRMPPRIPNIPPPQLECGPRTAKNPSVRMPPHPGFKFFCFWRTLCTNPSLRMPSHYEYHQMLECS